MSDLRSPFLPAEVPPKPKPPEHCANCTGGVINTGRVSYPCPHDRGAAKTAAVVTAPTPHASSPTGVAVVSEHCERCNGDGQVVDSFRAADGDLRLKRATCPHCINGRRTRPASGPESMVALDEQELDVAKRTLMVNAAGISKLIEERDALRERLAKAENRAANYEARAKRADEADAEAAKWLEQAKELTERLAAAERELTQTKAELSEANEHILACREGPLRAQVETLTKELAAEKDERAKDVQSLVIDWDKNSAAFDALRAQLEQAKGLVQRMFARLFHDPDCATNGKWAPRGPMDDSEPWRLPPGPCDCFRAALERDFAFLAASKDGASHG